MVAVRVWSNDSWARASRRHCWLKQHGDIIASCLPQVDTTRSLKDNRDEYHQMFCSAFPQEHSLQKHVCAYCCSVLRYYHYDCLLLILPRLSYFSSLIKRNPGMIRIYRCRPNPAKICCYTYNESEEYKGVRRKRPPLWRDVFASHLLGSI